MSERVWPGAGTPWWRLCVRVLIALLVAMSGLSLAVAQNAVDQCEAALPTSVERVVLSPGDDGTGARVEAFLSRPVGAGRHAAIVFLHGTGGLRPPRCYAWALERLAGWGYVTLVVDSQSGRLASGGYSFADQARDAVLAHAALARMPFVDARRIGLLGYSKGGTATLAAISTEASRTGDPAFQAAVVFYPICQAAITLRAPLLLLIGDADRVVSAPACHHMRVTASGHAYVLKSYPDADHLFDLPWWPGYRAEDADDAIARTQNFFGKYLATSRQQ